ncbi:hypothetical protein MYCTH_2311077 [Thermothelomyces thermophilus ATCC 42464]|uniref:Fe2OG dioxygenase domain-containing protein n=1 Tax=Thermothelomyces thermophilus (strain ATCC 42464 / BCRC 31852 / DSM 1799) TaxID=573729 RepID=G2QMJ3_THET4|nr:uncharacterized protein MYCTH_2311077 [Thermothelomyces thermophilus ATCC 42464]AEO61173.1 hypothetical protein MYCTH_2311077 [Thermothelomyces thermophilus ATCC 42464]
MSNTSSGESTMPTASQSKISESPLFRELRESVAKETVAFTFACGGTIPIVSSPLDTAEDVDGDKLRATECLPIDLRWDPNDESVLSSETKLTFPLEPNTEKNLDRLIKDTVPATFGLGGEHVYDESYRKATKLDPTRFSSTFNPYELGIIDAIAQTLLPSLRHSKQTRSVKAELYKLNLYSGPSGKFKTHVDTPRSPAQFGSLVVCLPVEHRGGALEVRHKGKTVTFDWSNSEGDDKGPSIGWAAFYSDCEHEVLEVTHGHRLTLTYNLFCVRGNGQLGGNYPWLDPTHLPLYKTIRSLVQEHDGWRDGGYLGYNCSHVYPHTSKTNLNFLAPDNLKGADMLMYEIFRSLGLKVSFRPVVTDLRYYDPETGEDAAPVVGLKLEWTTWRFPRDNVEEEYDKWTGKVYSNRRRYYWRSDSESESEPEPTREPGYIRFEDVHWLNNFGHKEPQISWVAHGNEPAGVTTYSCCAIIAEIPSRGSQETGNKTVQSP